MPFLPLLIRDLPDIPHLNLIYLLFVFNSALSYFYACKQSLIIADQRQYVVTAWQNGLDMVLVTAQAVFLLLTRNYFVYLGLQIGMTLLKNIILSWQADRYYPFLRTAPHEGLDDHTKQGIVRNIKALFTHNLGGIVVFGTDNLLIAHFLGMAAVGLYSNYLMVVNTLKTVYDQLFRSTTASVGNLGASEDSQRALSVFWNMNFFGCWLFGFSSVCLHKPFYICNHSTVGARIESLLESTGLTGRMATQDYVPDLDGEISWTEVDQLLRTHREQSMEFLRQSLTS